MNAYEQSSVNRANAAHSTGPRTLEGKQRAAMNALKHGLTGQQLILQPEEHDAYRRLSKALRSELRPRTEMEHQLVQKITDTHIRLNRVAAIDNNMLNFGLLENLPDADNKDANDSSAGDETAIAHAQAKYWIAQQMSFEKLGRYEGRLSRQLLAYTKELERLQTNRREANRIAREREQERTLIQAAFASTSLQPLQHRARSRARLSAVKGQDLSPTNLDRIAVQPMVIGFVWQREPDVQIRSVRTHSRPSQSRLPHDSAAEKSRPV